MNDNERLLVGPWPISRAMGRTMGSMRYFTNIPCVKGHLEPRLTKTGACYTCAHEWRHENKEKIAQDYVVWRNENRDSVNAYKRVWSAENAERTKESRRATVQRMRDANPEKYAIAASEYYYRKMHDPEFRALQSHRSKNNRAKRLKAEGFFTQADVDKVHADQNFMCAICGSDTSYAYQVDHILALSRGGSNWPINLQILCKSCNCRKGSKTMDEFFAMIARRAANDNAPTKKSFAQT